MREGVTLRAVVAEDHATLKALRTDVPLQHLLMANPGPSGDPDVADWVQRREAGGHLWAIDTGVCAGFVQLAGRHGKNRFAWLGICVDPAAQGQGVGRGAMEALAEEARALGLRKLLLEVRADNKAAIKLYAGLGYAHVGRLRDHYDDGARFHDSLIMETLL